MTLKDPTGGGHQKTAGALEQRLRGMENELGTREEKFKLMEEERFSCMGYLKVKRELSFENTIWFTNLEDRDIVSPN